MLPIFLLYIALVSAIPFQNNNSGVLRRRELIRTSRYTRLTKRINPAYTRSNTPVSYNTLTRPSDQEIQQLIEVSFNNVPRSLLLDTGSSDAWMVTPDVQCLDADLSPVPRSECKLGDAYDGPEILQIGNETYSQIYGTKEVVSGPIGYADVTVAGLTVEKQKVALVNEGYILGDGIRSGGTSISIVYRLSVTILDHISHFLSVFDKCLSHLRCACLRESSVSADAWIHI